MRRWMSSITSYKMSAFQQQRKYLLPVDFHQPPHTFDPSHPLRLSVSTNGVKIVRRNRSTTKCYNKLWSTCKAFQPMVDVLSSLVDGTLSVDSRRSDTSELWKLYTSLSLKGEVAIFERPTLTFSFSRNRVRLVNSVSIRRMLGRIA